MTNNYIRILVEARSEDGRLEGIAIQDKDTRFYLYKVVDEYDKYEHTYLESVGTFEEAIEIMKERWE